MCVYGRKRTTPLLHELHLLPVCFRVQFKVVVLIFKALYGTGSGYLNDHLFLISFAHCVRSGKKACYGFCCLESHMWWGFWCGTPTVESSTLWGIEWLSFQPFLKKWLCQQGWNSKAWLNLWDGCIISIHLLSFLLVWFLYIYFSVLTILALLYAAQNCSFMRQVAI